MQNPRLSLERMTPIGICLFKTYSKREQAESVQKFLQGLGGAEVCDLADSSDLRLTIDRSLALRSREHLK
jgi:hypothetical protein